MNNKPRQIQINNEDEDNISIPSSPEENTKEPMMTPRRTTTPKWRHSFSKSSANTPDQSWEQTVERIKALRQQLTGREREKVTKLLISLQQVID